jgi:N-acetylglucosamine-6-phosphate deacetylase
MQVIKNVKLITKKEILENQAVIFDAQVREIVPEGTAPAGLEVLDGAGNFLAPGFMNLHIHGCNGYDTMDQDPQALPQIAQSLVKTGVTSFLPTTMTMDFTRITQSLAQIRLWMRQSSGAQILGCHLEGPFINAVYKGAQDAAHIIKPDFALIRPYADVIRMVTLAPEISGSSEFIAACRQHRILVSLGHSQASYEQAIAAFAAGATHITHTFNAMPSLHHRTPGLIAAALLNDVTCELITDNVHVHPAIQRLLVKLKGTAQIVLVTDSIRACLLQDGDYDLGGQSVRVCGNEARLSDGHLAGSVLTMNRALKNIIANTGIPLWEAIAMASLNPAKELGLDRKGRIEPGADADLVLFDPDFNIRTTIVAGQLYRME